MQKYPELVEKSRPLKKIKETGAIFEQVHKINQMADETAGYLRLSMDCLWQAKNESCGILFLRLFGPKIS